ncbi:hypothetical protein T484DRAFT_2816486 [Baffinella frigidus]|nr:hypothetical protein T484DRAFT_2816486 [Cryptophyta sp. CCMP2293]
MVRVGGLLFGILPAARDIAGALQRAGSAPSRAIRWLSTVVQVKTIPAGWCVGYECAARAPEGGGAVALLPLGSHDGFLEPSAGFTVLPTPPHLKCLCPVGRTRIDAGRSSELES